jgi:hypothetical protein
MQRKKWPKKQKRPNPPKRRDFERGADWEVCA